MVTSSVGDMHRTTRIYCHTCRHIRTFKVVDPYNPDDPQERPELACLLCGSRETVPPTRV